jgi:hypothetical protein
MITREFASEEQRARTLIARLELVSHGTVAKIGGDPGGGDGDGPLVPPGGVIGGDDFNVEYPQKSHIHFRRRLDGCWTEPEYGALARDVEEALEAWQRTPAPSSPEPGTLAFKRMIANSAEPVEDLARKHSVSRAAVYRYRKLYGKDDARREAA